MQEKLEKTFFLNQKNQNKYYLILVKKIHRFISLGKEVLPEARPWFRYAKVLNQTETKSSYFCKMQYIPILLWIQFASHCSNLHWKCSIAFRPLLDLFFSKVGDLNHYWFFHQTAHKCLWSMYNHQRLQSYYILVKLSMNKSFVRVKLWSKKNNLKFCQYLSCSWHQSTKLTILFPPIFLNLSSWKRLLTW